jgi:hypothetical protein
MLPTQRGPRAGIDADSENIARCENFEVNLENKATHTENKQKIYILFSSAYFAPRRVPFEAALGRSYTPPDP